MQDAIAVVSDRLHLMLPWIAAGLLSLTLGGCAAVHKSQPPPNPPSLHGPLVLGSLQKMASPERVARQQYDDYYKAFSRLRTDCGVDATSSATNNCQLRLEVYIQHGIGLIDSYCRQWFQQMDNYSRRLAISRSDHGVLSQLGTALIGVAKLHPDVTAAYGALGTAYTGSLTGAESLLLIAPETTTIESQVFAHLNQRASELRVSIFRSVPQAQGDIESYARICTWKHAKSVVDKAVDQARTKVTEDGGVRILGFSEDNESVLLRTLWRPQGVTNADVDLALRDWILRSGLDISISELIYAEQYALLRKEAVAEIVKALGEPE